MATIDTAGEPAGAHRERLLLLGRSAPLSAILTEPAVAAADRPWLVLLNAGILHKIGPNRMTVRLARAAAARGLTAVRFDFAGVGDCPARSDGRTLAEGVLVDIREAIAHLQETRGASRFITVGLCSGADNAMRAARVDPRVVGVCLLDPTIHRTRRWYLEHLGPRLATAELWRRIVALEHPRIVAARQALLRRRPAAEAPPSDPELFRTGIPRREEMAAHLRDVLARQVQLFIAFSGGWAELYNYRTQLHDVFPEIDFGDRLRLEFYPQAGHTFDMVAHRQLLLADILDWAASAPFPG
jgi:dienelactone hydrolase